MFSIGKLLVIRGHNLVRQGSRSRPGARGGGCGFRFSNPIRWGAAIDAVHPPADARNSRVFVRPL